jgi:hypothetical protein
LEKQVSGIKDNVLYDLPRRSAVARNILEKAVEKGDLATAAQYLQQLQTQHMLNTLLVEYPSLRLAVQKVRASQNIGGTPQ